MAAHHDKYDSALLAILQNEGKVAPFLDVVLGFLYRRTDFFRIMKTETDKLGFPPGVAHKLLVNIFKKYETLAGQDAQKMEELKKSRTEDNKDQTTAAKQAKKETVENNTLPAVPASVPEKKTPEDRGKESEENENSRGKEEMESMKTGEDEATGSVGGKPESAEVDRDGEEEEDPEQARLRRELQANPLTYNGAERDTYFWSQNISETDLRVKMPKTILKGKQVKVDIKKKRIKVSREESDGSWCDIIDKELAWTVNAEECVWTLTPGEYVHINLEKKQERWWENVFVDEPKINTRKIDCSRPMTDLDDEAQAKIEEMMFNQRQKQLGLPQSHETKTHDILRKAWDAEGSPFKGQPFDPSKFSVDPSGVVNFNQPPS